MKRALGFGLLAILILTGIALTSDPKTKRPEPPPDPQWATDVLVMRTLRGSMHDPNSFEVVQVLRMTDKTLCITYRARNAFNALRQGHAVIAPKAGAISGQPQFHSLWQKHCNGKAGEDISHIRHAM